MHLNYSSVCWFLFILKFSLAKNEFSIQSKTIKKDNYTTNIYTLLNLYWSLLNFFKIVYSHRKTNYWLFIRYFYNKYNVCLTGHKPQGVLTNPIGFNKGWTALYNWFPSFVSVRSTLPSQINVFKITSILVTVNFTYKNIDFFLVTNIDFFSNFKLFK